MQSSQNRVLVVAAHPDDEVLGCGGTIARLSDAGAAVTVMFFADGVGARSAGGEIRQPELTERRKAAQTACHILGAEDPLFFDFPDNRLDTVPLIEVTQTLEKVIEEFRPDSIYTHHAGDVNADHRIAHQAVVTACRPQPGRDVRKIYFFEVASSTEWQTPGSAPSFQPTSFVDISETLPRKIEALKAYAMEMRPWPHARSIEANEHLARWRGATAGFKAAEAFMLGRELI